MGSLLLSIPEGVRNGGQRMSKKRAKTNDRKEEEELGKMPMKGTSLRNKSRAKISCRKSRAMQYSSNGSLVLDMAAGRIDRWKD